MALFDIIQSVVVAGLMFAATNADDLVMLAILFAQPRHRTGAIVAGQLAGIGALTGISLVAAMFAVAVPGTWLPWAGLVPLAIGLRWLRKAEGGPAPIPALDWWSVTVLTMANGADNLGIYIPTFAIQTGLEKVVTSVVFAALTLGWCWLAWSATRHPTWGPRLSGACRKGAPYVLILIGVWIIGHHPVFGLGGK